MDFNIIEEKTKSRWKNKNVLVFGDSISTPNYPLDDNRYPKWTHYLREMKGFKMYVTLKRKTSSG